MLHATEGSVITSHQLSRVSDSESSDLVGFRMRHLELLSEFHKARRT